MAPVSWARKTVRALLAALSLLSPLLTPNPPPPPEDWSNFGQGAPETGDIPGAVPKPKTMDLAKWGDLVHEYGPTTGIQPLRQKVVSVALLCPDRPDKLSGHHY